MSRTPGPSGQDWTEVKLKPRTQAGQGKQAVKAAAQTAPGSVTTVKKTTAGTNKQHKSDLDLRGLDKDDGDFEIKVVGPAVAKAIQQARQNKGMTQKDLAVKIQEKPQVVQLYEQGKAVPSQQILAKMEKALGVKLRGIH